MPLEELFLQWKDHGWSLSAMANALRADASLVDCTLAAEGQFVEVHRLVLAACSPYFELLLRAVKEKHPVFILKDVKFEDLKAVLDFMYCGEVGIPNERLGDFLKTAKCLQVKELMGANDNTVGDGSAWPQGAVAADVGSPSLRKRRRVANGEEAPEYAFVAVESIMSRGRPRESSAAASRSASCSAVGPSATAGAPGPASPAAAQKGRPRAGTGPLPCHVDSSSPHSEGVVSFLKTKPTGPEENAFERQEVESIKEAHKGAFADAELRSSWTETSLPLSDASLPFVKAEPTSPVNSGCFSEDLLNVKVPCELWQRAIPGERNVDDVDLAASGNSVCEDAGTVTSESAGQNTCANEAASVDEVDDPFAADSRSCEGSSECDDEITIEDDMKFLLETDSTTAVPISAGPASPNSSSRSVPGSERRRRTRKEHRCAVCDKAFTSAADVRRHERVHTMEKPYTCRTCEACFANSSHLKEHERTHTGEKPYKCKTCGAGFAQSSTLKKHEPTHTREKPYKCETCKACFKRSSCLMQHKRIHTGKMPYKCKTCEACYLRSSSLKIHERTHTGEKPYKCRTCEACFAHPGSLNTHVRNHREEDVSV